MAGRVRVAALVLGLVLLGGAVACGDDDSGDVSADGTSTTAPASGGSSDLGGGGVRPAPPAGDPSIRGSIAHGGRARADRGVWDVGFRRLRGRLGQQRRRSGPLRQRGRVCSARSWSTTVSTRRARRWPLASGPVRHRHPGRGRRRRLDPRVVRRPHRGGHGPGLVRRPRGRELPGPGHRRQHRHRGVAAGRSDHRSGPWRRDW